MTHRARLALLLGMFATVACDDSGEESDPPPVAEPEPMPEGEPDPMPEGEPDPMPEGEPDPMPEPAPEGEPEPPPPLDLDCGPAPDGIAVDGSCFVADLPYGEFAPQAIDLLIPANAEGAGLVVFIHGGGFTGGDKASAFRSNVINEARAIVEAGHVFATINYRLIQNNDAEGVIKSLSDSRRALQFLRYHAASIGIDPERVVLWGGSAGGGTSLWLAARDDMARPMSADPVEQMSTRVRGAAVTGTQSTYDLVKWETVVFASFPMLTLENVIAAAPEMRQTMANFYGLGSLDDLAVFESPEMVEYRQAVDILAHLSPDDPPLHVVNNNGNAGIPMDIGALYHHGLHAEAVRARAAEEGIDHVVRAPAIGLDAGLERDRVMFTLDRLQ
jgi:acetyl esterase/lipase